MTQKMQPFPPEIDRGIGDAISTMVWVYQHADEVLHEGSKEVVLLAGDGVTEGQNWSITVKNIDIAEFDQIVATNKLFEPKTGDNAKDAVFKYRNNSK